jgi:hypothetical protein
MIPAIFTLTLHLVDLHKVRVPRTFRALVLVIPGNTKRLVKINLA